MEPPTKTVISTQPSAVSFDFLTSIGQQMAALSMNQSRPVAPLSSKLVRLEPSSVVVKPIIPEPGVSGTGVTDRGNKPVKVSVDLSSTDSGKPPVNSEPVKEVGSVCDNVVTSPKCSTVESGGELLSNGHELLLQELELLRAENKAQREQLKLQSQVNNDLKKLLVASVGEDIEARVHFLTEDKVKLANDIRRYVEQLTVDFETKETLSVQADLWRSKYLAANVLVDELRQWKTALSRRCDQLQNCIRLLLDEHNKTRQMSLSTQKNLSALLAAFVPKSASPPYPKSSNVLDIVQANVAGAEILREKLSGHTELQNGHQDYVDRCPNTNGERLALNLLIAESYTQLDRLDVTTSVLTGETVSLIDDETLGPLRCCQHCGHKPKSV